MLTKIRKSKKCLISLSILPLVLVILPDLVRAETPPGQDYLWATKWCEKVDSLSGDEKTTVQNIISFYSGEAKLIRREGEFYEKYISDKSLCQKIEDLLEYGIYFASGHTFDPENGSVATLVEIKSLSPIADLKIRRLELRGNTIRSLEAIRKMTWLKHLVIASRAEGLNEVDTLVEDLSPLEDLNLESLVLEVPENSKINLKPIVKLSSLQRLHLGGNTPLDISWLAPLRKLRTLTYSSSGEIFGLEGLSGLNIESLTLWGIRQDQVEKIPVVFSNLDSFTTQDNLDLTPIKNLPLTSLFLQSSDSTFAGEKGVIEVLKGNKNLKIFYMSNATPAIVELLPSLSLERIKFGAVPSEILEQNLKRFDLERLKSIQFEVKGKINDYSAYGALISAGTLKSFRVQSKDFTKEDFDILKIYTPQSTPLSVSVYDNSRLVRVYEYFSNGSYTLDEVRDF